MHKQISVALIGDYPLDDQRIDGGVQAVMVYLVEALKELAELDLHVISFQQGIKSSISQDKKRCRHHILPKQRFGLPLGYRFDLQRLQTCLKKIVPDIVHAQGSAWRAYLALHTHYPNVITFHGMHREEARFAHTLAQKLRYWLGVWLCHNYCLRTARHAILISPYLKTYLGKRLSARVYDIPNPVKPAFFSLTDQAEQNRILLAGRIIPIKGVIDLLQAICLVREQVDFQVILAGSLKDAAYVATIKNYIAAHALEDQVVLTGLLDEQSLLSAFERCSCLVLPAYQEIAPMVIQQAMAAGKPVIATDVGGIPFQVDHGTTGLLVHAGDVEALAKYIVSLLQNHEQRKEMGRRAKEKALANYHAKQVAMRTVQVYQEVLGL